MVRHADYLDGKCLVTNRYICLWTVYSAAIKSTETKWIGVVRNIQML